MPSNGVGGKVGENSSSDISVWEFFRGLVILLLELPADKNRFLLLSSLSAGFDPTAPGLKLLLCPGTLLIGESSASLNLAVALDIPHAGVGLSSGVSGVDEEDW